jgi:Ca2+-transporting ATPase
MNKDSRGERGAWHTSEVAEVLQTLGTDAGSGLGDEEAARRLEERGPNELEDRGTRSPLANLWDQFSSTMIVILIVAALASALLGDYEDSIAIAVIVVLNAALGFVQEYRAERAMAALKRLSAPRVKVRREGHVREISARELVPGDVVLLEAGNLVPADGRLVEGANLRVQEAALTGESEPVEKDPAPLEEEDAPLGERAGMVYLSTVVARGRGLFVVTETGMATELGKIAAMIQASGPEQTPLQRRLNQVGRVLVLAALAIVGVVFTLGLLRGENLEIMFLTAVSLAVAAVPEGLPAVVTIALALGAQRMLRRRALIRKLPAVETLGSVTVICSDKTGTLTENRMTATVLDVAGHTVELDVENPAAPSRRGCLCSGSWPPCRLGRGLDGVRVPGNGLVVLANRTRDLADDGVHDPDLLPTGPRNGHPLRERVTLQGRPALEQAAPWGGRPDVRLATAGYLHPLLPEIPGDRGAGARGSRHRRSAWLDHLLGRGVREVAGSEEQP